MFANENQINHMTVLVSALMGLINQICGNFDIHIVYQYQMLLI